MTTFRRLGNLLLNILVDAVAIIIYACFLIILLIYWH